MHSVLRNGARVLCVQNRPLHVVIASIIVNKSGVINCIQLNEKCIEKAGYQHLIADKRIHVINETSSQEFILYDVILNEEANSPDFSFLLTENGLIIDINQNKTFTRDDLKSSAMKSPSIVEHSHQEQSKVTKNSQTENASSNEVQNPHPSKVNQNESYYRILTEEDFGCTVVPCDAHLNAIKSFVDSGLISSPTTIQLLNAIDFHKIMPDVGYSKNKPGYTVAMSINKLWKKVDYGDKREHSDDNVARIIAAAILVGPKGQITCKDELLDSISETGYGHFIDSRRIVTKCTKHSVAISKKEPEEKLTEEELDNDIPELVAEKPRQRNTARFSEQVWLPANGVPFPTGAGILAGSYQMKRNRNIHTKKASHCCHRMAPSTPQMDIPMFSDEMHFKLLNDLMHIED